MRLFIAIEIPGEIKHKMADVQRRLKDTDVDAGWTRPEGIHLTLKFLGEIPESKVPDIMGALTRALGGTGWFRLEIERVGTLPRRFCRYSGPTRISRGLAPWPGPMMWSCSIMSMNRAALG